MKQQDSGKRILPLDRHTLSVIVPVFNEQEVLSAFHRRLSAALTETEMEQAEILYVNDGSTDDSLIFLLELARKDRRVQVLDLSRNFGKEAAMSAGLDHARGDAVILIDADLQDPPELIPELIREWRNGYDMVSVCRLGRDGESWLKRNTARLFYKVTGHLGQRGLPENVGDFRLLSRRSVEALKRLPERTRFMKGLFAWIGFPSKEINCHRDARKAGTTKWSYWRLWNLALEGITSLTVAPLKIASYLGVLISLAALSYGVFIFARASLFEYPVSGHAGLVVAIFFLGGMQLLAIGIIGEYLSRVFIEAKQRPLYLLNRHHRNDSGQAVITPIQEGISR